MDAVTAVMRQLGQIVRRVRRQRRTPVPASARRSVHRPQLEALESRLLLNGTAEIHGFKFDDSNGNGIWDQNEAGIAGVTIFVDQNDDKQHNIGEPSAVTAADGSYSITGLAAGDHVVREVEPADRVATFPTGLSDESRVNTTTANEQGLADAAMDDDGNYVVVWHSGGGQDGDGRGIFGQRYLADGSAIGGEFAVNNQTAGDQSFAVVAMTPDGRFVVAWVDSNDGNWDVYARRFNADGTPNGAQFLVHAANDDIQETPVVAVDDQGNFVVSWQSTGQDGSGEGVFARRFLADGSAAGDEFQVNTLIGSNQRYPDIAMTGDGDFVIAWTSVYLDGSDYGIAAQRFAADASKVGGEFQVNTYTAGTQYSPAVAIDQAGNFVIVWDGNDQDGSHGGIFGQRFGADGTALGDEFQVNSFWYSYQDSCEIAMKNDGTFAVTWRSDRQDADGIDVYAQRFDEDASHVGMETRINQYVVNAQTFPAVAASIDDAPFVFVWDSALQDGSSWGVYQRQTLDIGQAWLVTLVAGEVRNDVNFGNQEAMGAIAGVKFNDLNSNGNLDDGEPTLPDWTIYLDADNDGQLDVDEQSVVTEANGQFVFSDLLMGDYHLREIAQNGWLQTAPALNLVELSDNGQMERVDMGNHLIVPMPDLIATFNAGDLPAIIIPGDVVTVPVTITNRGNAPAVGNHRVALYSVDSETGDVELDDPIAALTSKINLAANGGSVVVNVSLTVPKGIDDISIGLHTLAVRADDAGTFAESNEFNNVTVVEDAANIRFMFGNFDGRQNVKLTLLDTDEEGTDVTLSLTGNGVGELFDNDAFESGDLLITGTNASTVVTITTAGGDRVVDLANITVGSEQTPASLKSLVAGGIMVLGNVSITGGIATLTLGDIADDHAITIGADAAIVSAAVKLGHVTDTTLTSDTPFKSLAVLDWTDDSGDADVLDVPWIGTLTSAGDFEASLQLSGEEAPALTLTRATIAGNLGMGAAENDVVWEIFGNTGGIDASKGTTSGWELILHSSIKDLKLGVVTDADVTIGDLVDGKLGDVGTLSAKQWGGGSIEAGSIKTMSIKKDARTAGADGDFFADLMLTGSANLAITLALGSAVIDGDLGSNDPQEPVSLWNITGNVGSIIAATGTVDGWQLDLHSNLATLNLGLVNSAVVTIGDLVNGKRGDVTTLSAKQWIEGSITAGSIKTLNVKRDAKLVGADGDIHAALTLTGSMHQNVKQTLGKATIDGDLSGDWNITGDIGTIDNSKGAVAGWDLLVQSNVATLKLGTATDLDLDVDGNINAFSSVGDVTNSNLQANVFKTVKIGGNLENSDLRVQQAPAAGIKALGALTVMGEINDMQIISGGHVGPIKAARLRNTEIFTGVVGDPGPANLLSEVITFAAGQAKIDSITLTGVKGEAANTPSFIDTMIAAYTIGKATLKTVDTTNGATALGLAAHTFTAAPTANDETGVKLVIPLNQDFTRNDFNVRSIA